MRKECGGDSTMREAHQARGGNDDAVPGAPSSRRAFLKAGVGLAAGGAVAPGSAIAQGVGVGRRRRAASLANAAPHLD